MLAVAVVATFVTAELWRDVRIERASIAAKCGWVAFVVLLVWWLWEDCGVLDGMRRLGRLLLLGALAFAVLHLYYRRAQIVDAGVEVDAIYTFVRSGLVREWRDGGDIRRSDPSFSQMPMQLFGHLPGYVIGFRSAPAPSRSTSRTCCRSRSCWRCSSTRSCVRGSSRRPAACSWRRASGRIGSPCCSAT